MLLRKLSCMVLGVMTVNSACLYATNYTWTDGTNDGQWTTNGNWTPAGYPSSTADNVTISVDNPPYFGPAISGDIITINQLTLGAHPMDLPTLSLDPNSLLTVNSLILSNDSRITLFGFRTASFGEIVVKLPVALAGELGLALYGGALPSGYRSVLFTYPTAGSTGELTIIDAGGSIPLDLSLVHTVVSSDGNTYIIYEVPAAPSMPVNLMLMTTTLAEHAQHAVYNPLRSHLANRCGMKRVAPEVFGDVAAVGGSFQNALDFAGSTLSLGTYTTVMDHLLVGGSLFYEYDKVWFAEKSLGNGDQNSALLSLYALYRPARYYAFAQVSGGYTFNETDTQIGNRANLFAYVEGGYDFVVKQYLFQPFVGLRCNYGQWAQISAADSQDLVDVFSRLGVHLYTDYKSFEFGVDLSWDYRLTQNNCYRAITSGTLYGIDLARSALAASLYAAKNLSDRLSLFVEGDFSAQYRAIAGSLQAGAIYRY